MERENLPSSDCDKDEDFNLLTVINEHSEVIGLITDDRDTNSQNGQNDVTNSNEIEIFHPPADLESDSNETNSLSNNDNRNGNGDESDSDQNDSCSEVNEDDSDDEDQEHYIIYQEDPGSSCGPFIGNPGLLIEPQSCTPEGFFSLLFDNSMWTLLAQQTNIYARQRIQQLRGIILHLFLLYFCLQHMF